MNAALIVATARNLAQGGLVAFVLLTAWPAAAQNDVDICTGSQVAEEIIDACNRSIESGRWRGADLAWAYVNRGVGYTFKNEVERAIADYNEAIRLDPNLADAFTARGNVYGEKGEIERALADYNEAIRLDPKDAKPLYNRGMTHLYDRKDRDSAIRDFRKAAELGYKLAEEELSKLGVSQ
jgi:tetratricopeptide (TPR) repeat protein